MFAGVVGHINPDVTFCQSSVGTEATRLFAEPSLERIGELASRPRPCGAGPRREGLGGAEDFGLSSEASAQALGESKNLADTLWLSFGFDFCKA